LAIAHKIQDSQQNMLKLAEDEEKMDKEIGEINELQHADSELLQTIIPKIPIVFFGRLEVRKGLCTFVSAIQQLDPETQKRVQIYCIGKIVQLNLSQSNDLTSDQYIEQELNGKVTYEILSDLYSQEAIELIRSLDHPIVCLTSHQENFPNSGLEMGQLPVSLVVSDTGGFRETLAIVNRFEDVYWFKPENPNSLAEILLKALSIRLKTIQVTPRVNLNRTNQQLLAQKINFINDAFSQVKVLEKLQPKVTIGVTCYNLGQYLVECLTSIEAQTYENLEVIVLDDASPDPKTRDHINHAKTLFPNYKFICAEQNLGLGGARNRIIELASGDYFLPLDVDNRLLPFGVEKFVEAAQHADAAIVIAPMLRFGETQDFYFNYRICSLPHLLQMNNTGDACSLFSTALLKKFKHSERKDCSTHDWGIFAAAVATDEKIVHYPYPLYEYRVRENSMIKQASFSKERYYLRQYLAQIPPADWSPRQIYMLMTGVQQLNAQLSAAQAETAAAQAELKEVKQHLRRVRTRKTAAEGALEDSKNRLSAMETSKFWKLRKGWFKLKKLLRLPNPE